jgi:hypothetical protein
MKNLSTTLALSLLIAGLAQSSLYAASEEAISPDTIEEEAPAQLTPTKKNYAATEKDLDAAVTEQEASGEEALIETSHPYLLPRLFTLPTAYSLQSYEVRFGGQGNIHSTLANMNSEDMKVSLSVGLGGITELGYQLDEYYTVENTSDKILMGYFKLALLRESKFVPAVSISASKNLRSTFRGENFSTYHMDEDLYEVVVSKAFHIGDNMVSFHPGAQIIRDNVTAIEGKPDMKAFQGTKINPRLGVSWQSRPKTLFMYELKVLHPTDVAKLGNGRIETDMAVENNLGIRYYIRNWLCMDSGIRHFYNTETKGDEMKLHANFVGVIPMETVYSRVQSYFKK